MKKTKTVIIRARKAVPEHTNEVEVIVCDICGLEDLHTSASGRITQCTLCDRHIHYGYDAKCSTSDPEDWGDYPAYYCSICYDLRFKKYKEEADRIEEEHFNAKDAMEVRIKAESLATKV